MTDLTGKFAALELQLANQHTALMAKLDSLITAIGDLRGVGPENTLRSINQSIWNLAGPAPGRSLAEMYDLLLYINSGLNAGIPGNYSPYAITTNSRLMEVITNLEALVDCCATRALRAATEAKLPWISPHTV